MICKLNRFYFTCNGQFRIRVPSGNRVLRIQRNCNIRNFNVVSADAFLRGAYSSLSIQEEHIVSLLEYRVQLHIIGCADRCSDLCEVPGISRLKLSCILRIGPAKEFAAGLFRCSRRINLLTVFDFLLRNDLSICIIEIIGCDCRLLFTCDDINGKLA